MASSETSGRQKSPAKRDFCARQSDHRFENDVCLLCGITWVESVRGFGVLQKNFEMPGKSFRHKRIIEAMGGDPAR